MTGASVTNKGIYYEQGKEPGPDQPPKLHLLIESNDEFRVSTHEPLSELLLSDVSFRWSKQFGKSRGYSLRHPLLRYKQSLEIQLVLLVDILLFNLCNLSHFFFEQQ